MKGFYSHITWRPTIKAQSHRIGREATGSRETGELQVPDRCSPAARTMSFMALQVPVRQRHGSRSQGRQWWEMFPHSRVQQAQ